MSAHIPTGPDWFLRFLRAGHRYRPYGRIGRELVVVHNGRLWRIVGGTPEQPEMLTVSAPQLPSVIRLRSRTPYEVGAAVGEAIATGAGVVNDFLEGIRSMTGALQAGTLPARDSQPQPHRIAPPVQVRKLPPSK